ncbi:hypothetical protein [Desulforamulus hydrothermalis]|uniref:Uncharacterized protein n=1 Tax=Desulforamulus hydrothermalis Lam5 = DSM 18033 TaxID=1121428 RepID=K8DYC8_9FIRM|nr:hypothetical protein [Desulforamulus hydrothermalis]CCO07735.1 conserved hypothetical protein [Desulforamulus hydrothermalis Lam5 = DSM 18033]SHH34086.1 hypothetical protein SAMN02745177_02248 [Desulforamulus hydrothermalis Lam5 = DSM 18033]
MWHCDSLPGSADYLNEQALNKLIEACHRTIDWSVDVYFRLLRKNSRLLIDKVLQHKSSNMAQEFAGCLLNEAELAQLIKDIETHINHDLITVQNKWLPDIKFALIPLPSLTLINQTVKEQKISLMLSEQANKTVSQVTFKKVSRLVPVFVPKFLSNQANQVLAQKICSCLGIDSGSYYDAAKEILTKQLHGLLANIEQDLKTALKYQLAEQMYHWYDQYVQPAELVQQVC